MKWEYKTVANKGPYIASNVLNKYGKYGWELVNKDNNVYTFKREKTELKPWGTLWGVALYSNDAEDMKLLADFQEWEFKRESNISDIPKDILNLYEKVKKKREAEEKELQEEMERESEYRN